ncbi:histidinol-phosphatase [Ruminococcaceae bacterium OttesenSCG-928-A16]|nr:histidinol-phosphatase [Ruminococcaceae bacterium OttesenSCG-928-A16]
MKITSDAHVHTRFCDGRNTPAEMAEQALALGYTGLGFSAHSPAPFDDTCPGIFGVEKEYIAAIAWLKKEYAGRLDILCGIEQDYEAPVQRQNYDYILGSVHYLPDKDGQLVAVDGSPEHMRQVFTQTFGGNETALVQAFYKATAENVRKYHPDIVGHFDLIVKHNQNNSLFNEDSETYKAIATKAMDAVIDETLAYGGIIEINTGGVARGYRAAPYPAGFLLNRMAQRGARIMLTSDSHATTNLGFGFAQALTLVKQAGFKTVWVVKGSGFIEVPIE